MIIEIIGGLWSGSLTLLADAGHMLTDTASLALAWAAGRTALRPADKLRSYGYHRIQILAAFINGLTCAAIVVWICIEAAHRLFEPGEILGGPMLAVATAGLVINLIVYRLLHRGDQRNINLRGAMIHVLGDLLGSAAAIVGAIVILMTGWFPIDPVLAICVGLLILHSAWRVIRQSGHILLEGTPEDMDVQALRSAIIEGVPIVRDVHHVHVWSLTPDRPLLTLHAEVEQLADYSVTLGQIKNILSQRFGIVHATIQIELGPCNDET